MPNEPDLLTHRILVIDDNPAIHQDYRKILIADGKALTSEAEAGLFGEQQPDTARPRFDMDSAMQGRDGVELARAALAEGRPYAVAFVDMRMPPGWDGLETVEQLWKIDPDVQVVICSAYTDYDWLELLARLGHSDKLIVVKKPFEPIEILQGASALSQKWQNARALKRHVESLELVVTDRTSGLEAANRQLRHLASHDALTGLPNRLLLDDRIAQAIAHSQRHSHEFAVLVIDLDRFKFINDSLGHRAGDELLREVAQRLKSAVRAVDTTARLGGDEFVVLLDGPLTQAEAVEIGTRAIKVMEPSLRLLGIDVHISASIGIAFYPRDGASVDTLLARADAAMYSAKERGRNNLQCYAEGMSAMTQDRVKFESELHEALRNKQFELHYQPLFDMSDRRLIGFEALIRLPAEDGTLIPPLVFIPVAEDLRLIDKIGAWVLLEACSTAETWPEHLTIAVNLSPAQFLAGDISNIVTAALKESGLAAHRLELEITETLLLGKTEAIMAELQTLKAMGVAIVMDDFGTGYSSLSYLWRFPFDKIKIDRSFMQGFDGSSRDAETVVKTIIALGRELHMRVTVEGVETAEQAAFLDNVDGDQAQGFFFGRPVPASEVGANILADFQRQQARTLKAEGKLQVVT